MLLPEKLTSAGLADVNLNPEPYIKLIPSRELG
jgi:hypothetical protein